MYEICGGCRCSPLLVADSLLPLIAAGDVFGHEQPIILYVVEQWSFVYANFTEQPCIRLVSHLLDIEPAMDRLQRVGVFLRLRIFVISTAMRAQ